MLIGLVFLVVLFVAVLYILVVDLRDIIIRATAGFFYYLAYAIYWLVIAAFSLVFSIWIIINIGSLALWAFGGFVFFPDFNFLSLNDYLEWWLSVVRALVGWVGL